MSQRYYYCEDRNPEAKGPLELKAIEAAIGSGMLSPSVKLCHEGGDIWVRYGSVKTHGYVTAHGMVVSEMNKLAKNSSSGGAKNEVKQHDPTPQNHAERTHGDLEGIIDVIGALFIGLGGMVTIVGIFIGMGGNPIGWFTMASGLSSVVSGILFKGLAKIIGLLESILAELRKR